MKFTGQVRGKNRIKKKCSCNRKIKSIGFCGCGDLTIVMFTGIYPCRTITFSKEEFEAIIHIKSLFDKEKLKTS